MTISSFTEVDAETNPDELDVEQLQDILQFGILPT